VLPVRYLSCERKIIFFSLFLIAGIVMAGNKCGHDISRPRLSPPTPIPKGPGAPPRILSLAAERAKAWYQHPQKCKTLYNGDRQVRSERREAHQIIIEAMLSLLDLSTLCLGKPSFYGNSRGFVDVSMKDLVNASGMNQRRCERAIRDLKEAGLVHVPKQRREINEQGEYYGLRAIRVIKEVFFDILNLGPMLKRERNRASAGVRERAAKIGRTLGEVIGRRIKKYMPKFERKYMRPDQKTEYPLGLKSPEDVVKAWHMLAEQFQKEGRPPDEVLRRTNELLGLAEDYSPGR